MQQGAKLCVGIVQDWITFELAIRIHNARGYSDISEAAKKKLRFVFSILFTILILAFLAYSLIVISSARKEENIGIAFFSINECFVESIIGNLFLCQVIVMVLLVTWLFIETKRAVNRERRARQDGQVTYTLRRERCTYAFVSFLFGVSYIGRYFYNNFAFCRADYLSNFMYYMV